MARTKQQHLNATATAKEDMTESKTVIIPPTVETSVDTTVESDTAVVDVEPDAVVEADTVVGTAVEPDAAVVLLGLSSQDQPRSLTVDSHSASVDSTGESVLDEPQKRKREQREAKASQKRAKEAVLQK